MKIILKNKHDLKDIIINNYKILSEENYKIFCNNFNNNYDYSLINDVSNLFMNYKELNTVPDLNFEQRKFLQSPSFTEG